MAPHITADRLLDAAAEVFGARGYHDARVSEIARAAGVAQGTVYLYFESKERLYEAVLERFAEAVRGVAARIRWDDIRSTVDLRDRFADLYTATFELCARNRGVAGLVLGGPPVGRSSEIRARLIRDTERISTAYLEAGAASGLLRPLSAAPIARAIVGLLVHTATWTIVTEGRTSDLCRLAEELLDFELYGLVAPSQLPPGDAPSAAAGEAPAATALHSPEV